MYGVSLRTSGAASTAQALVHARQVLPTAPQTTADGRAYRHVAILLMGSVANVFLNRQVNYARDICADLPPYQALYTAQCQREIE